LLQLTGYRRCSTSLARYVYSLVLANCSFANAGGMHAALPIC